MAAAQRDADKGCCGCGGGKVRSVRVRRSQAPADQAPSQADHPKGKTPGPVHRKRGRAGCLRESLGVREPGSAVDAVGDAYWPPTKDSCYGKEN